MMQLTVARAEPDDAPALALLINSAYRGESSRLGWTTEADLLDGRRTDVEDLLGLIGVLDSRMLVIRQADELLGSVHIRKVGDQARIGMLAVSPLRQGCGIGKQLLRAAETEAQRLWPVRRLMMAVIPSRAELIAFYQRQGYRRTGIYEDFPVNPALWTPKVKGLRLEWLEKLL